MKPNDVMIPGLNEGTAARSAVIEKQLRGMQPDSFVFQTRDYEFDIDQFAEDGLCALILNEDVDFERRHGWAGAEWPTGCKVHMGHLQVAWKRHKIDILRMTWPGECGEETVQWLIAPTYQVAHDLHRAVCAWCTEVRGEVLVFQDGWWSKSTQLFEAIKRATLGNLVLAPGLKEQLRSDIEKFLGSRDTYQTYGVPWKRGVLLIGPPGNGKTHAVKALLNHVGLACLYVKSFTSHHSSDHANIRKVFDRARNTTPCALVLEDIDSLVNDKNRSYFLNELDGFAENQGILVLASTNHPDRLDPAIVNRPSRFDRKYHFELPGVEERAAFLRMWNAQFEPAVQLSEEGLSRSAESTDGFSFAYLKELALSTVMAWINGDEKANIDAISLAQASLLRDQMSSMDSAGQAPSAADDDE